MKRKIVLASHGRLSEGLLDTATMIIGDIPFETEVYSLQPGKNADDYVKVLREEMITEREVEYVILTDLYGASVFSAMYSCVEFENAKIFTGMNLNMLLSICLEYPNPLSEADIEKIIDDSREGIQIAKRNQDEKEEF